MYGYYLTMANVPLTFAPVTAITLVSLTSTNAHAPCNSSIHFAGASYECTECSHLFARSVIQLQISIKYIFFKLCMNIMPFGATSLLHKYTKNHYNL